MSLALLTFTLAWEVLSSYLIYLGWKQHSARLAGCGWLGIFAAMPFWIIVAGPEFGIFYSLFVPAICVWTGIIRERKWQPEKSFVSKADTHWQFNASKVAVNLGHILVVLPLILFASSMTTITIIYQLPTSEANQLASGILLLPMLWATLVYWYLVAHSKWLPVATNLLATLLSGLYLFG